MLIKCKFNPYIDIKLSMNSALPPNIDPNLYALTADLIGYALSEEFNSYELNSLGNWLELLVQYLLATAAQKQLNGFRNSQNSHNINLENLLQAIKQNKKEI